MIVDANILLYATDSDSPFHGRAAGWLEQALNGPARVGLPWQSLAAFLRLATHPRASRNPLTMGEAWQQVDDWLAAEPAWIPAPGPGFTPLFRQLTLKGHLAGNLVPDAQLAALALEHGTGVCSADSDFARFPGLPWLNPVSAS